MSILQIIGAVLKLITMFFGRAIEMDKEKKAKLKEASNELTKGIKNRDASAVLRAFNKRNRL